MTENTHKERRHSLLGGSSAHCWSNCSAYVFYMKDMPPQEQTEDTLKGTVAHELCEIVLADFLEHKISGSDPDIRAYLLAGDDVDDEMLAHVHAYREAVWEKGLNNSITGKAYGLEDRLVLDENLDIGGPADFWSIEIDDRGKRAGLIVDFKYGYHTVNVERNPQLAVYASGLRAEVRRKGKDLDYVRAAIFQPRGYGEAWKETVFTGKQLDTWEKKFYKAADQIYVKKKPKFKVGEWCTYCRAKGICPAYKQHLESKTSLQLVRINQDILPKPEQISDAQLAAIIEHKDDLTDFIKSCYSYALMRCKTGKPLNGFKVVNGTARRKWKAEINEIADALNKNGIDPWGEPKLIALTTAEKQLTPSLGKDGAKEFMVNLTEMTTPSELLVPDSDPRQSVLTSMDLLT